MILASRVIYLVLFWEYGKRAAGHPGTGRAKGPRITVVLKLEPVNEAKNQNPNLLFD